MTNTPNDEQIFLKVIFYKDATDSTTKIFLERPDNSVNGNLLLAQETLSFEGKSHEFDALKSSITRMVHDNSLFITDVIKENMGKIKIPQDSEDLITAIRQFTKDTPTTDKLKSLLIDELIKADALVIKTGENFLKQNPQLRKQFIEKLKEKQVFDATPSVIGTEARWFGNLTLTDIQKNTTEKSLTEKFNSLLSLKNAPSSLSKIDSKLQNDFDTIIKFSNNYNSVTRNDIITIFSKPDFNSLRTKLLETYSKDTTLKEKLKAAFISKKIWQPKGIFTSELLKDDGSPYKKHENTEALTLLKKNIVSVVFYNITGGNQQTQNSKISSTNRKTKKNIN